MPEDHIETGLAGLVVTAAVTDDNALPAVVAPAAMPSGWTIHKVAALVRDLAMNLYDEANTVEKHALTPAQYEVLKANEFFKRAVEQATIEWNSPQSTQRRLALESAIALEDALPTVAARLSKSTEPLSDVVALIKVLSEIAGTTGAKAQQQTQAASERFKIVINLGADLLQREATPNLVEVRPIPEGTSRASALSAIMEATGVPAPVRT